MNTNPIPSKFYLFAAIAFSAWTFWTLIGFCVVVTNPDSTQYLGQFVDWFGALNAFIGICAVCGAIYTIYLQTKQIGRQEEHIQSQFKHEHELFRREKFERVVFALSRAVDELNIYLTKLTKNPITNELAIETINVVDRLVSEPQALIYLYFPTFIDGMEPVLSRNSDKMGILQHLFNKQEIDGSVLFKWVIDMRMALNTAKQNAIETIDDHIANPWEKNVLSGTFKRSETNAPQVTV